MGVFGLTFDILLKICLSILWWDHPSLFLQADCAQSPTAKMAEVFFKVSNIFPKGSIVKMATFILWKVCSAVFWRFFFFVFLQAECARLKHTLATAKGEHEAKMAEFVREEKEIKEENLRLQRRLQLEMERREALCR